MDRWAGSYRTCLFSILTILMYIDVYVQFIHTATYMCKLGPNIYITTHAYSLEQLYIARRCQVSFVYITFKHVSFTIEDDDHTTNSNFTVTSRGETRSCHLMAELSSALVFSPSL